MKPDDAPPIVERVIQTSSPILSRRHHIPSPINHQAQAPTELLQVNEAVITTFKSGRGRICRFEGQAGYEKSQASFNWHSHDSDPSAHLREIKHCTQFNMKQFCNLKSLLISKSHWCKRERNCDHVEFVVEFPILEDALLYNPTYP
jgi:hypothetical protein